MAFFKGWRVVTVVEVAYTEADDIDTAYARFNVKESNWVEDNPAETEVVDVQEVDYGEVTGVMDETKSQ